jgi:parallel beta helix pectate lyase-like protein
MIGPRVLCLLALCAAVLVVGVAPAAADPYDAQLQNRTFSASFLPTLPFALGEVDLATIGVPNSEFATVGPSTTASSPGDGPNMYIVDNDLAQCPNAAYTSIQAAVNASGPGDQIRVCPGTYLEQVLISGPSHDGLTLFSQQPLQAIIKAPPLMTDPGDIVRVNDADDVTIRHFTITGPLPDHLFCSLFTRTGVRIDGNGSATLRDNYITEIRSMNPALRGCQNGIAVLVGRRFEGQVGDAWITHNLIDKYQKGGVVVDNQGSFATVDHNEIVGPGPQIVIAPNGIQISRNAAADVSHNIVTENSYIGADNGTGILLFRPLFEPPPPPPLPPMTPFPPQVDPVNVHHNRVFLNDDGIALYNTDISFISHNRSYQQRRYDGIYVNSESRDNTIDHNDTYLNFEHDCHDDSVGGGTGGTANFWIHDKGDTQNRAELCKGATTIP